MGVDGDGTNGLGEGNEGDFRRFCRIQKVQPCSKFSFESSVVR